MIGKISLVAAGILLASSMSFAQDMLIDENGNVGIGTESPSAKLEVVGNADSEAVVGSGSGSGIGVYGENLTTGNYGLLGNNNYGVFGYSPTGYAGYFLGNTRVEGNLTVNGLLTGTGIGDITDVNAGAGLTGGGTSGPVTLSINFAGTGSAVSAARSDHQHDLNYSPLLHNHSGYEITGGTISQTYIDPLITRDSEVMPIVLANDGPGSGLNADTLDGKDSTGFADSVHTHTVLEGRVATLEAEEAKAFVVRAARAVSDRAYTAEPELEMWMKAVQKAYTLQGAMTEVDTDGDGTVTAGADMDNNMLSVAGVVYTFVQAKANMGEKSPWNDALPLWIDGGFAGNQPQCNAAAAANPGQITLCYTPAQYFYIKNIFVSAADDAGNIIYQRSVSGYSDSGRRDEMIEVAKKAVPEIEKWLAAVRRGAAGDPLAWLTEVDTDGDGTVVVGSDLTNIQLSTAGVVTAFVSATNAMGQVSPWNGQNALWVDGGIAANQAACDAVAAGNGGQISMCYVPYRDRTIKTLFISAADNEIVPNIIFHKSFSAYSDSELRESMADAAKEAVPELENWIRAVQKAGTLEGNLVELDTDGDGTVNYGSDLNNNHLAIAGLVNSYVAMNEARNQRSPWNAASPLWREGGPATNQYSCDMEAINSPGQITVCYNPSQNNLIKAIFISAVDNDPVPNFIYQKSVSGYTERERMDSTINAAEEAVPELKRWIAAVRKGALPAGEGLITEIDTDGDGAVIEGTDLNNYGLSSAGVVSMFAAARHNMYYRSFWNGYYDMWSYGGYAVNQQACNAISQGLPGLLAICFTPAEDHNIQAVFISASNEAGMLFYQRTVTGN